MYGAVAYASRPYAGAKVFVVAAAAITFEVAIAGGGASQAGLVKSVTFSAPVSGGGAVLAPFSVGYTPTPANRSLAVAAEFRTLAVAGEDRTLRILQ